MLERDYIMRLIREFMAALQKMLEKKEVEDLSEKIKVLYNQYVGPYSFYQTATMDDIMNSFTKYNEGERLYRIEMLAELYYAEADMKPASMGNMLLDRALLLFSFIDSHSKTYSIDRTRKIDDITKRLKNVNENPSTDLPGREGERAEKS